MMKKMMLFMALMCAMTTTAVFTSCGDDDDKDSSPSLDDTTPAKVAMSFSFKNSADMLNYCNIEVSFDNGKGIANTLMLTKELVDTGYWWNQILAADLPTQFKLSRKVTLKENVDISSLEKFTYSKGISYAYALYNAAGKKLDLNLPSYTKIANSTLNGEKVTKLINQHELDQTLSFTFASAGSMTKEGQ